MLGVAEESRANVQAYLFLPCVLTFGQQPVHATQCWSKDLYTEVSLSLDGSWHVTTSFTSLLEDLPRHPSNSPLQPLEIFAEEVCKQMISEAEDFTKSLRAELWYWEQKWLQIRTWDLSCHESWLVGFFFFLCEHNLHGCLRADQLHTDAWMLSHLNTQHATVTWCFVLYTQPTLQHYLNVTHPECFAKHHRFSLSQHIIIYIIC